MNFKFFVCPKYDEDNDEEKKKNGDERRRRIMIMIILYFVIFYNIYSHSTLLLVELFTFVSGIAGQLCMAEMVSLC